MNLQYPRGNKHKSQSRSNWFLVTCFISLKKWPQTLGARINYLFCWKNMKKSDRSFFKHAKNNRICCLVFRKKTHVKTPRVLLAYPNIFTAFGPKKSLEKPTKPNRFFGQRWPGKLTPNDNQNAKLPTSRAKLPTFSQPCSEGKLFCLLVLIRDLLIPLQAAQFCQSISF